jgi:hypothetical protein
MPTEPRLEHQTLKVKQLVEDYRTGRIVIPEFQREYVWRPSKAPHLIDSLYRGFPVSSFLLWQSEESTRARRADPRPQRAMVMNWLIDGQQRVITLSRTMNGDEGIDVMFHPDQNEFRLANAATRQDPNWFRVSDLWDDNTYRRLRHNIDSNRNYEKWEARFDAVRRILDYEIPVVRMVDHSFTDAVDAFTRINTLGVRLKAEDIESAQIAARHSGFIADEVSPFLKRLHQQGFRRLNIMHLFRACAFVATPDGRNRTPLHEMKRQEVLSAWKTTERATVKAMGIIRGELGLVNMDILWSGALVVPLIAMCATVPVREFDPKELVGWLSLASLFHRYSGSSETALDQDLRACRDSDPIGSLLTNLRNAVGSLTAEPKNFSGALADKGGLFALYIACMNRGILDFYKGGKVLLQDNVDRHHILPRAQFPERKRPIADNVANMAFITGPVNKSIGKTSPEIYLKTTKLKILKSQCIPADSTLWKIDQSESFWRARRKLLADSFNEYIRKSLPQRHL